MIETPQQDQALFDLINIAKQYNGRWVLDIDRLVIKRGEILAIVGPSGSGKSTLLRLLNFLETPTRGSIAFMGQVFENGKEISLELRRRVTTVFQRPMLLDRSVWENVRYGLRIRGISDAHQPVQSVLEEVGLAQVAQQRARTLSGGEAQRVALARALVISPEVLLLDEPTANLDPYNISLIENIIRRRHQDQGMSLVLVTHNVFQARRLADRIVFLLDGKIIEVADTYQFFNQPSDPRTQAFVRGEMVY